MRCMTHLVPSRSVIALYWISINIGLPIGLTAVQCEVLVSGQDTVQLSGDQVVWFANLFRDCAQMMKWIL